MDLDISPDEQKKQLYYRDARTGGYYGEIWKTVGKCVFCDMRKKYIVMEEGGMVLTVALFAYIDGNVMIVPRRHVKSVKELSDEEWQAARKLMYIAKKLIRKIYGIKGVQYVLRDGGITAQSTVADHLHIHVVPFDAPDLSTWNYRKLTYTPLENAGLFKQHTSTMAKLSEKFDEKYTAPMSVTRDKKEVYREAFQQLLTNKKASQAKKTARVGASVIVGDKVISMCNVNLAEGPMEHEKDGTWVSPPTVSHAEERCIAYAAKEGLSLQGATMLVSLSPCMVCSRLIVNSGVKELHYIDDWWDQNALQFLAENGVNVKKLPY